MANTPLLGSFSDVGGSSLMFRNKIINGDMRINQRFVSAKTNNINNTYTYGLDRWALFTGLPGSAGAISTQRLAITTTDAPYVRDGLKYYNRLNRESAAGTSAENCFLSTTLEGHSVGDLNFGTAAAKVFTISFWARASGSYNFSMALTNSIIGATRSYVQPFDVTTSWQKYVYTITADTSAGWGTDESLGLQIRFIINGASSTTAFSQWKGDNLYVGGTTSFLGLPLNSFLDITGVQLEAGPVATPFEQRPVGMELALCQRYFEKSYNIDVAIGTNTTSGSFYNLGASDGNSNAGITIQFKVPKRIVPSAFFPYSESGNSGWNYTRSGVSATLVPPANITTSFLGQSGGLVYMGVGAAWTAVSVFGHWAVSAEF